MKKFLFTALSTCCVCFFATAQVNYQFQKTTEAYQNLSNSISLNNGTQWDEPDYQIDLGFTFHIFGNEINRLYMNDGMGSAFYNLSLEDMDFSSLPSAVLIFSPLFTDLNDPCYSEGDDYGKNVRGEGDPGGCSNLSYLIEGDAGNRIFKFEWNNASLYGLNQMATLNMQVWLYENGDVIEYRFGENNIPAEFLEVITADGHLIPLIESISLTTESGVAGILSGDPANPTFQTLDATEIDESAETLYGFTSMPASGTVYRFVPDGVGIQDHNNIHVTLSPNPVQDLLTISGAENAQIQIFDILGNLVLSTTYTQPIAVSNLASGTYIVKVKTDKGIAIEKMIK